MNSSLKHAEQNQKCLHIKLPSLGIVLILRVPSQVWEFTSASTLPYNSSLFLCVDLSCKQVTLEGKDIPSHNK